MDDMTAFENQVAREVALEGGPSRPVDVSFIVASANGGRSAGRWSVVTRWFGGGGAPLPTEGGSRMFSALKIVTAAVVVAAFGGFLIAGLTGEPQETEPFPAAVSPSPPASAEAVVRPAADRVQWLVHVLHLLGGRARHEQRAGTAG